MGLPEPCQEAVVLAYRSWPQAIMPPQMSFDAVLERTTSPDRSITETPTGSVARTKRSSSWLSRTTSSARLGSVRSRGGSSPANVAHSYYLLRAGFAQPSVYGKPAPHRARTPAATSSASAAMPQHFVLDMQVITCLLFRHIGKLNE